MSTDSRANWFGIAGWLLLLVWVGFSMYQYGRANEKSIQLAIQIDTAHSQIRLLESKGAEQVKEIDSLRVRVVEAKARVVYVDKLVTPSIDSAVDVVKQQLDSLGQIALARVIDGYEAKVAVRDHEINRLEALVDAQDHMAELQRDVIAMQKSVDSLQTDMAKQLKKIARPGLLRRLLDALPVAAILLIAKR